MYVQAIMTKPKIEPHLFDTLDSVPSQYSHLFEPSVLINKNYLIDLIVR